MTNAPGDWIASNDVLKDFFFVYINNENEYGIKIYYFYMF